MNTLNKEITAAFYAEPQGYTDLMRLWSDLMQDREARNQLTAAHHLLYMILRGKNWRKAISPITNAKKLANGAYFNWGGRRALLALHSEIGQEAIPAPFAELLAPNALALIQERVPRLKWNEDPMARDAYAD